MVDTRRSSANGRGGVRGSGGGKRRSSSPPSSSPGSPAKRSKAEVTAKGAEGTEKPKEKAPVAAAAAETRLSSRSAVAAGKRPAPLTVQNTHPPTATGLQAVEPPPGRWARLIPQGNQIFKPDYGVPISASATLPPSSSQKFKDGLKQGILGPDATEFTLEHFPYYLSTNTKSVLLSAASIHMQKKLIKSLSGISSLNQRILLSGPSGSEIYQETLIKALAKNFGSRLLTVDSFLLPVNELSPDLSGDQEALALGIGELIEVIWEESKSTTSIILVKDVEKALTGRIESHGSLGKELPPGVLIIGSHTEKDSPKDKIYYSISFRN